MFHDCEGGNVASRKPDNDRVLLYKCFYSTLRLSKFIGSNADTHYTGSLHFSIFSLLKNGKGNCGTAKSYNGTALA